MTCLTDDGIKHDLHECGVEEVTMLLSVRFTADDLKKSALEDVKTLNTDGLLKIVEIRGFVLSTESVLLEDIQWQ